MSKKLQDLNDMSESDDSDQEQYEELITQYQNQIKSNKYDYDAHIELIQLLRKCGELEALRKSHLEMNKIYPLSSELWLAWLADEQKICCTKEEREFVVGLFKKAVKEYMSVQLWVEYIMFMLGGGNAAETRQVCEEALTAVGIHLAEGILVWQAVILVEQQFLGCLPAESKEAEEQRKRVQNVYRRASRVALMNRDAAEFSEGAAPWLDQPALANLAKDLQASDKKVAEKLPFEQALLRANTEVEKLEAYRKYLDFVRKNDNPALIQNLYERAVTDLCLNAGMWEEYVRFTMDQFSSAHYAILPVCARSQRNCPWSSALFELRITALQLFAADIGQDAVKAGVEESLRIALENGNINEQDCLNTWHNYLVYLRLQIGPYDDTKTDSLDRFRQTCDQAMTFMEERFECHGDPECRLARFRARFEAESVKDMEAARHLWNEVVMKTNNNFKSAKLWIEFVDLERHFGTEKHCRKLYRRALERVWDGLEDIGSSFLQFEQQLGTLESMLDFDKRYRDRLAIVQKRRMEDKMKEESRKEKLKKPQERQKKLSPRKFEKHDRGDSKYSERAPLASGAHGSKRSHSELEDAVSAGLKKMRMEEKQAQSSRDKDVSHGDFVEHDPSLNPRTVFLSNMDYNATEEAVLAIFRDCGPIETLRIARDYRGRSKGFAYLVFETAGSLEAALAKDRTPVGIRPLFVSKCNPKDRGPSFKYNTGVEKEKLFVKGLALGMTEKDIRAEFEPHGDIKSMRLVTNRNGYSKGTCYIEYHDAATAESVRAKMDNAVLKGKNIVVLISNPAEAAKTRNTVSQPTPSLPQRPFQRREAQKPKLSLVPRSLQRKGPAEPSNAPSTSSNGSATANGLEKTAPKSNDDFRKLFNK